MRQVVVMPPSRWRYRRVRVRGRSCLFGIALQVGLPVVGYRPLFWPADFTQHHADERF
jgi:hypothetical protein